MTIWRLMRQVKGKGTDMAFVLVDQINGQAFGPFDTKSAAEVAARSGDDRLGGVPWGDEGWTVMDFDAKVIEKWEDGETVRFGVRGLFDFRRVEDHAEQERKLLEWGEVSIRLTDFLVYCLELGVIAPAVFGEHSRLDIHEEVLSQFAEEYVTQAQAAE